MTAEPSEKSLPTKPKLIFFQWNHRPQLRYAKYLLQHTKDHVRCLEQFFDVVVISEDCDYDEMCERHTPDMALFEVGYQSLLSHRIDIRNTSTHPRVFKAALLNADSWAWTRAGAISDMDNWGIGVGFSICTTIHDYMPEAMDGLFSWPNFVDPTVFRDYGEEKNFKVMLTGSQIELYPWRRRVAPLLSKAYPTFTSPAHNYYDARAAQALTGERYARALNASLFAPTCGTMAGEIVRKHFEISGSGCCLITEDTPMAEEAGFRHLENCVFADSDDVIDILDALMADPDQISRITAAGHDLVHSRHTMAQRPQIYQWYLLKAASTSDRIEQRGPFEDVLAVDPKIPNVPIRSGGGLDRILLHQGYASLLQGDADQARTRFSECVTLVVESPEGKFGLALCELATGDPGKAANGLARLIELTTVIYGAQEPDPVEWAFYLFAIAQLDRASQARRFINWYPRLSHPALDHVAKLLSTSEEIETPKAVPSQPSIHDRFVRGADGWDGMFSKLVNISRDPADGKTGGRIPFPSVSKNTTGQSSGEYLAGAVEFGLLKANIVALKPNVPPIRELDYLGHVGRRLRRVVRKSPIGETLASARRYSKEWRERRES